MNDLKTLEKSLTEAILSNETYNEKKSVIKEELIKSKLETFDWSKYCFFVENTYTRNAVIHNDNFTILVLCWAKGMKSQIHDHPCDGCFIVGLDGTLIEQKFEKTDDDFLVETEKTTLTKGSIAWMHDSIGLHQIINPNEDQNAITLHIYYPPFNVCKVFDKDGFSKTCYPKFFSINGEKIEN